MAGWRGRGKGRIPLSVVALGLFILLMPTTSVAAPTWLAPRDLSAAGQDAGVPRVALDGAGDAFAVWEEYDGSDTVAQVAVRPAGGNWSSAQDLSPAGSSSYGPALAVDPAGDAIAVFVSDGKAYAARRPAGAAWGAPRALSAGPEEARGAQVVLDPRGDAVAVWVGWDGSSFTYRVQASSRPAGGTWSAPQYLSVGGQDTAFPEVALDAAGNAVAVWELYETPSAIVQAASRPAGGPWGSPQDLTASGQSPDVPELALDRAGNAVAVWQSADGIIRAAARPAGGGWNLPQEISLPGNAADAKVAIDPGGNAIAVWERFDGSNYVVQAGRRVAGIWAPPENLSATGQDAFLPDVALDPFGNAVAVWTRSNGSAAVVQAALRPVGGGWAPPQDLSAAGGDANSPTVAYDGAGNAVAAWGRSNGAHVVAQAVGLDAAGPVIGGISITGKLTAGGRAALSVSAAADVWSSLAGPPHWFFGDGAEADGASVTHVYRTPGHYNVTVSQADAVGNRGSAATTVTIAPVRCVVPRVIGKTLARAKRAIKKGHCRPGKIGHAFSRRVRTGRVLSQRPKPGRRLRSGAPVNLVVSRGPRR
jgi:hypothetical protein